MAILIIIVLLWLCSGALAYAFVLGSCYVEFPELYRKGVGAAQGGWFKVVTICCGVFALIMVLVHTVYGTGFKGGLRWR